MLKLLFRPPRRGDSSSKAVDLVKIVLFARVSSNKYGVWDILERERLELSVGWVQYKAKPKRRGPTLEETRPDHAIRSSIAITKWFLFGTGLLTIARAMN